MCENYVTIVCNIVLKKTVVKICEVACNDKIRSHKYVGCWFETVLTIKIFEFNYYDLYMTESFSFSLHKHNEDCPRTTNFVK